MHFVVDFLVNLIWLYQLVLIVRIIFSWVQVRPYNPIVQFIYQITDPVLDLFRNMLPFLVLDGLDLSPIVVFFLLGAIQNFIAHLA